MADDGNKKKYYNICITVLEARNLAWPNMKSFVSVEVAGKKKYTRIRERSDRPFFNEYFVFDLNTTLNDLLDKTIIISVYQPRRKLYVKKKKLGSVNMDIGTVWYQKEHQIFHKWLTITDAGQERGFLKCDLKVFVFGEDYNKAPKILGDGFCKDLIVSQSGLGRSNLARYIVKIYRAGDILCHAGDSHVTKKHPAKSFVKISFSGLAAKTSQVKHITSNVNWNEGFTFFNLFPPTYCKIKFNLFVRGKEIFEQSLLFDDISDDSTKGFLPKYGPSYKYSYTSNFKYLGYLLFTIETFVINAVTKDEKKFRVKKFNTPVLNHEIFWNEEEFICFAVIFNVSVLEKKISKQNMKITISCGQSGSGYTINSDSHPESEELKITDLDESYNRLMIQNRKPCVYTTFVSPDTRNRLFLSNSIAHICYQLENNLSKIDKTETSNSKILVLRQALKQLKDDCNTTPIPPGINSLDSERRRIVKELLTNIVIEANNLIKLNPNNFKDAYKASKNILDSLKIFIVDPQDSLPNTVISLRNKNKIMYSGMITPEQIIYANVEKYRGLSCGVRKTIFLKKYGDNEEKLTSKAKLEIFLWLGMEKQIYSGLCMIPKGYEIEKEKVIELPLSTSTKSLLTTQSSSEVTEPGRLNIPIQLIYHNSVQCMCYAHIYQGYLEPNYIFGFYDTYVKVIIANRSKRTRVIHNSIHPVWSETLLITDIMLFGDFCFFKNNPPTALLEVWDATKKHHVILGNTTVISHCVLENEDHSKKSLEWIPVFNNGEKIGKILVLLYLLESSNMNAIDTDKPLYIVPATTPYRLEVLFWGIRGLKLTSSSKPFVFITCGEVEINSPVIEDFHDLPNFTGAPIVINLDLPLFEQFFPPFVIRVMDSKWFGMRSFIGSGISKDVFKNIIVEFPTAEKWLSLSYNPLRFSVSKMHLFRKNSPDKNKIWRCCSKECCRNCGKYCGVVIKRCIFNCIKTCAYCLFILLINVLFPLKLIIYRRKHRYELIGTPDMLIESEGMRGVPKIFIKESKMKYYDWWTKYYASKNKILSGKTEYTKSKTKIMKDVILEEATFQIYGEELEAQEEFNNFSDTLYTFNISHKVKSSCCRKKVAVCSVKAALMLYKWPVCDKYVTHKGETIENDGVLVKECKLTNKPVKVLLRVYVIQGYELRPVGGSNPNKPNAFIVVSTPVQSAGNSSLHIKHNVNPTFGKSFEFEIDFPQEYELTVKVMNHDPIRANELIGQTVIDLESRFYSKHRARCGLQNRYVTAGYNKWRDQWKPSEILELLCSESNIPEPRYYHSGVYVGGKRFIGPSGDRDEVALTALLQWETIPVVGCKLVREHVETRHLYSPSRPGVRQGSLEMWVDMFEMNETSPPPFTSLIDISPRVPVGYELRVIIWNTADTPVKRGFFYGTKHIDVFVKGWLIGESDAQTTDIHYRSPGPGQFNWRFVFPFSYIQAEESVIYNKPKSGGYEASVKIPARFFVQVYDKQRVTDNEFIGSNSFQLCHMIKGKKHLSKWPFVTNTCSGKCPENYVNLFEKGEIRGWWPVYESHRYRMKNKITTYIEMEFQLVTQEKALDNPVGKGRNEPHPLPVPDRQQVFFSLFEICCVTPCQYFFKFFTLFGICRWKTHFVVYGTVTVLIIFGLLLLYSVPGYLVKKILNA